MFNNNDKSLIWLNSFSNLTYHKKKLLFDMYQDNLSNLFENFLKDKQKILSVIDEKTYETMAYANTDSFINTHIKSLQNSGIKVVTILNAEYPDKLKNIDSPPFVLYCKGDVSLLKATCFAIVGTRRITNYGRTVTEKLTKDLCQNGFCIVSGLSSGVDTVAHETTLLSKGKTIAVLAGGLDYIYPPTNFNLSNDIVKNGGLLISECKPSQKPEPYYFPIRNRIIAGLSCGVLITEADEKSGSMHTKNYALDNNIDVYSVPGNITNKLSLGCNRIIANGQAKAVLDITDILDDYNIKYQPKQQTLFSLTKDEQLILDVLGEEELAFIEILTKTKLETKTLNTLLTTMAIRGIIKKLAGNMYSK